MKICLYHRSDLDGQCSGAIYVAAQKDDDYVLTPIDYGDPICWDQLIGADVTLIDFSLQLWSEFERLFKTAKSVLWIDHHRSAIEEYRQSESSGPCCPIVAVLDENKAACELAWEYYFRTKNMPQAVRLLGRYDLWRHEDERVKPFQYGLRPYSLDPLNGNDRHLWKSFLSATCDVDMYVAQGETILRYQDKQDAQAVAKNWFDLTWEGRRWQACNRLGRGSTFFDSVWAPIYDGMLSFFWDGQRRLWEIGLYSHRKDIDCGSIAKRHGGGGHPGAAGFRTTILPFELG